MSTVFEYVVPGRDLSQIHDALLRAGLTPLIVQGNDPDVALTMPDGTDEAAVAAVVAAHVPQTRYDPATKLAELAPLLRENRHRAAWRRLEAQAAGALTLDSLRVLVVSLVQELAARDREGANDA